MGARVYEFGPFRLDADKSVLWRAGEVVPLTPRPLAVLQALVESGGDVVTKVDLKARVWPDTAVGDANLSVAVSTLRRAIGKRDDGRSWIETVPRRGYRFDGPVKGPERTVSLAVLPFEVRGGGVDPHEGLGLADALISRLTAIETLRVRPTRAVTHLVGEAVAPRDAAQSLGVDAVLTGTLRREGERVRLSLQLVPRRAGLRPWARQIDTAFTDVFDVEDRLAEEVAELLDARLAHRGAGRAVHVPARDAWESYSRGRYFEIWLNPDGVSKAIGCFGEAAMKDPEWGAPQAGLADAHVLLALGGAARPSEAWDRAAACAERALTLDPDLAEAHAVMGWIQLFRDWDWPAARSRMKRALALEPESHEMRLLYGVLLDLADEPGEARRELRHALEADPLSGLVAVAEAFFHDKEPERWLKAVARDVELRPDRALGYWGLALASMVAGDPGRATQALRRAVQLSDEGIVMRAQLAWALARAGDAGGARGILGGLGQLSATAFVSPYHLAVVRLTLGEAQAALDDLERAADERDPWVVFLRADSALEGLRGERRFEALASRVYGRL